MLQSIASTAKGQAQSAAMQQAGKAPKSKFFKYLLVSFLLGAWCSCFGFLRDVVSPQAVHAILMAVLILFGILHVFQMNRHFSWTPDKVIQSELLFTLAVTIIGCIGFAIAFYLFGYYMSQSQKFMDTAYTGVMSTAFLILPAPWLFAKTFTAAINIPPARYKEWFYPAKPLVPDENLDRTHYAVVTFVCAKRFGETYNSNLQGKAIYNMKLGDMFYFFIQEWNYKFPGNEIQYLDDQNKSFGWYFYIKKNWWASKKFLDPDLTIYQNGIKVNEIMKTERIKH